MSEHASFSDEDEFSSSNGSDLAIEKSPNIMKQTFKTGTKMADEDIVNATDRLKAQKFGESTNFFYTLQGNGG